MEDNFDVNAIAQAAMHDKSLQNIYFNNILVTPLDSGDAAIILFRNMEPIAVLNTPYPVLKILAGIANVIVDQVEEATGQPILSPVSFRGQST